MSYEIMSAWEGHANGAYDKDDTQASPEEFYI